MLLTSLPDKLRIDGVDLWPILGIADLKKVAKHCQKARIKYRNVQVLSRKLRGVNDIHHQPYKPTQWLFIDKAKVAEVKEKFKK